MVKLYKTLHWKITKAAGNALVTFFVACEVANTCLHIQRFVSYTMFPFLELHFFPVNTATFVENKACVRRTRGRPEESRAFFGSREVNFNLRSRSSTGSYFLLDPLDFWNDFSNKTLLSMRSQFTYDFLKRKPWVSVAHFDHHFSWWSPKLVVHHHDVPTPAEASSNKQANIVKLTARC